MVYMDETGTLHTLPGGEPAYPLPDYSTDDGGL